MTKTLSDKVIAYRRYFHKYPELGWTEYATASYISDELQNLGFIVKKGKEVMSTENLLGLPDNELNRQSWDRAIELYGEEKLLPFKNNCTAVAGILNVGDGPTVVLRFDMDALPIQESNSSDHFPASNNFASKNRGIMHACGHDAHMAVGLGLANLITENRNKLIGTIILLFQPAEEGVRGADAIIRSGFLNNVDYIMASHIWSNMPLGTIVCSQDGTAATHKIDAEFKGKSSHAGICPEEGDNAMLAAANAILNIHAISRNSKGYSRINIGKMESGTGRNIIPEHSKLEIELRAENSITEDYLQKRCKQILKASAEMNNCELKLINMGEAKCAKGDIDLAKKVYNEANKIEVFNEVMLKDTICRGSEDFTSMMNHVQAHGGWACFIGVGGSIKGKTLFHHSSNFDIEENILDYLVLLYYNLLIEIC